MSTRHGQSMETKVAFITGSGRRLGRRIAYALADAGYDIVLHAHDSEAGMAEAADTIARKGRSVSRFRADLGSVEEIRRMCGELLAAVPRLDLLVNNAGVFPDAPFDEITEELWDRTLNVNLRAMFFITQALAPALRRANGSVVNLASAGAFQPWRGRLPYNVSKAGVVMLTRALARELAPEVRVNAIAPGIVLVPGEEDRTHIPVERIPLRRYGSVEDLAASVLFLAEGAPYTTGTVLRLDGGGTTAK